MYAYIEMENTENKPLGIPTPRYVFTDVAHVGRFMQPETRHQELYGHFLRDSFGLVLGGAIAESVEGGEALYILPRDSTVGIGIVLKK